MPQPYSEKTGKLIDAWIRLRYKIDKYQRSITDYINIELAEKADLSGRQIERMRRYDGFPEDKSMVKLIKAIPELKSLDCNNFVERLLLPFSVVEQAQNRIKSLPKGKPNTIVIIAGWIEPLGISQDEIAQVTTRNISRNFQYKFLYPDPQTYWAEENDGIFEILDKDKSDEAIQALTEKWVDSLRRKCEGIKYSELSTSLENRSEILRELQRFGDLSQEKISRSHTNNKHNKFWFLLPSNYTVLYNPDKPQGSEYDRYGMFNVKGKLVEFSSETLEKEEIEKSFINSSGWLYIDEDRFEDLAEMYIKIENDNQNHASFNRGIKK
jgi:hypothetical protein